MKSHIIHTILLSLILMISSCTTYFSNFEELMPTEGKKIVPLGTTSGSDSAYSVLGLWMIGRPDTYKALQKALKKKNADTIVHGIGYTTNYWFLLFSVKTVTVEGDAVKLVEAKK